MRGKRAKQLRKIHLKLEEFCRVRGTKFSFTYRGLKKFWNLMPVKGRHRFLNNYA